MNTRFQRNVKDLASCIDNIIIPLVGAGPGFCVWLLYFTLQDLYYQLGDTRWSHIISPLWLTIHYILYFIRLFLWYILKRRYIFIDTKVVEKWLREVAEADLTGDPAAWRRIAFRVNQCFMSERYNDSIFYSGEQCRQFLVREIAEPVKYISFDVKIHHSGGIAMDCLKDASNEKLIERAVVNYNKSFRYFNEETDVDMGTEYSDGVFKRFVIITKVSIFCLGITETAFSMSMAMATLVLTIYQVIF